MDAPPNDFEKIVQPIEQRLLRIAWNILGNAHDAEDALQDAMSIVIRRWQRVVAHPAHSSLIIKICTECALDLLRKRVRNQARSSGHALEVQSRSVVLPDATSLSSEVQQIVMNAVATLPRHQATAFTLRIVDEQDYDKIASLLGCSPATVRTHVARARRKLSVLLQHLAPNGDANDEQNHK